MPKNKAIIRHPGLTKKRIDEDCQLARVVVRKSRNLQISEASRAELIAKTLSLIFGCKRRKVGMEYCQKLTEDALAGI